MLYCILLCCVVLYCVILYCVVLCCIVLYCVVLYSIVYYITYGMPRGPWGPHRETTQLAIISSKFSLDVLNVSTYSIHKAELIHCKLNVLTLFVDSDLWGLGSLCVAPGAPSPGRPLAPHGRREVAEVSPGPTWSASFVFFCLEWFCVLYLSMLA